MALQSSAAALSRDLKRISDKFDIDYNKVVRKTALDIHRNVVLRTPVQAEPKPGGRAAGSWGISEGTPGSGSLPEGTYGNPQSASQRFVSVRQGVMFQTLWIFNNLPYIEVLEFGLYPGSGPKTIAGFSTQAPSGMVRVSLAEQRTQTARDLRDVLR